MDSRINNQTEPVCKFGPGGDFVSVWPPQSSELPQPSSNSLTKLLTSLREIIAASLGSDFNTAPKESLEYAVENNKAHKPAYPPTTAAAKSDLLLSGQPMLFPDHCRISLRTDHKPKHHIRASHRTAKKRPPLCLSGQGSLFEPDRKSAKTA